MTHSLERRARCLFIFFKFQQRFLNRTSSRVIHDTERVINTTSLFERFDQAWQSFCRDTSTHNLFTGCTDTVETSLRETSSWRCWSHEQVNSSVDAPEGSALYRRRCQWCVSVARNHRHVCLERELQASQTKRRNHVRQSNDMIEY